MREQDTVTCHLLQILLAVAVDFSQMLQQDPTSFEFFRTLRTLTEHIGRVYSHVAVQSARLVESLATTFTNVGLLS